MRLFHLHNHLGLIEYPLCAADNRRARLAVRIVVHADTFTSVVLDDRLVSMLDQFAHALRREPDTVFQDFDFLRYPDSHGALPRSDGLQRAVYAREGKAQ